MNGWLCLTCPRDNRADGTGSAHCYQCPYKPSEVVAAGRVTTDHDATEVDPYADITPGLWYLKTDYGQGFTVVEVMKDQLNMGLGELIVYDIGENEPCELRAYTPEQFICPVPSPFSLQEGS